MTELDKALDFIVEREEANDYICEKLLDITEEADICSTTCINLNKGCVRRFLKHYKEDKQ